MTLNADSFGDFSDVLYALGLANLDGSLNDDWLRSPGDYLKDVLANEYQRAALLRLLEQLLEGDKETDAQGREWLPIVSDDAGVATFFFVIDQTPTDRLRISLGSRIKTTGPDSTTSFLFPLFCTRKGTSDAPDIILLGQAGGAFVLSSEIIVDPVPPVTGEAGLRSVGLSFLIPTNVVDGPPSLSILLGGLQLPGWAAPKDIALSASSLDDLDDAALDLILGLIQSQAGMLGNDPITALAELLGLGRTVPSLPLEALFRDGAGALSNWFAEVIGNPASKSAWISALADLFGGGSVASVAGDVLSLKLGAATFDLTIRTETGPSGRPIITPSLSFGLADGQTRAECLADLVRIDLGSGNATAVPALKAQIRFGTPAAPVLTGDPAVTAIRVGIELTQDRQPTAILALDNVVIGTNTYPTLDLSSPDAIADVAGALVTDVIADLLAQLGSAGQSVSVLLGLASPSGAPAVPTIDLVAFIANPMAALRSHWQMLLSSHQARIPDILTELRGLLADAGVSGIAVSGAGSKPDPWKIPLVGPVGLIVWADGTEKITLGATVTAVQNDLGERCTIIETALNISLLEADLNTGVAVFAGQIELRADARARGTRRSAIGIDPIKLEVDRVSVRVGWSATAGLAVSIAAPNPALMFETIEIPLDIPDFDQGFDALTDAQWDAIELIASMLLQTNSSEWIVDVIEALGWTRDTVLGSSPNPARLSLAKLFTAPKAAIEDWMTQMVLRGGVELTTLMKPLARVLNGSTRSFGTIEGIGHPSDPFAIPMAPLLGGPKLTAWIEPSGPPSNINARASETLRNWLPGRAGLHPRELATALFDEFSNSASSVSGLGSLNTLSLGLEALRNRFEETDGRIAPPATLPAGVTKHVIERVSASGLRAAVDLAALFGAAPETIVHIAVADESDTFPFANAPDARRIDLRAASRAPATFAQPAVSTGEWFIALAPRAVAQLAASDPDGALGQAARLERVLPAFASVAGDVCIVADAASAHAAWIAAENVGNVAVSQLVTLGMALSPVSISILDVDPGASALRLLFGLLSKEDLADPDDPDLAAGRALLMALNDLFKFSNPSADLSPPAALPAAASAGLSVQAVYGQFDKNDVERAMTAVVAAGMSGRIGSQIASGVLGDITGAGIGLCLPIKADTGGIGINGHAMIELVGIDMADGTPSIRTPKTLRVRAELRRESGWLLGGPGSGTVGAHELHWLEVDLVIPLQSGAAETASVVLHGARIFGITRDRWTLASAVSAVGDGVVTTALPEVQVLLSSLMAEIKDIATPQIVAFRLMLRGIGIIDHDDAFVATALDRLLLDPKAQVQDALNNTLRRSDLTAAIDTLMAPISGLSFDLGSRTMSLALTATSNSAVISDWSLTTSVSASGDTAASLALGAAETGRLTLSTTPLAAAIDIAPEGLPATTFPIWPEPSLDQLRNYAPHLLSATAIRMMLEVLRDMDDEARSVIDAALDAAALLGPSGPSGKRAVVAPVALLRDPVGWFKRETVLGSASGGFQATKIVSLLDAVKPILGVAGDSGEWRFANGFALRTSGVGSLVDLSLFIDSAAFNSVPTNMVFSGNFGLTLSGNAEPQPSAAISFGLPGSTGGRQAVHLEINSGVCVFLRPASGGDIGIFPNPAGLGSLATTAVEHAFPLILNAVVDSGGTGANIISAIGDGLALREGAPLAFAAGRLQAWAADPVGELELRWTSISGAALSRIVTALDPVLPAAITIGSTASGLSVGVGPIELGFETTPFCLSIAYADSGLPVIETADVTLVFDKNGLKEFSADIGPAIIPAGGTEIYPVFSLAVGNDIATPSISLGLALAATGDQSVAMHVLLDPVQFEIAFDNGTTVSTDAADVASGFLMIAIDLLADFVLQADALTDLLNKEIPSTLVPRKTVRDLLAGVFLLEADTSRLDTTLFRFVPTPGQSANDILDGYLTRILKLVDNFADAEPSVNIDNKVTISLSKSMGSVGLTLSLSQRLDLTTGDIVVSLENDSRWIKGTPIAGLTIGLIDLSGLAFAPSVAINGVGIRISRKDGPLLDVGLNLGSAALHFFGSVGAGPLAGGVQIQLSDLAVAVKGATGGNQIAGGMMNEASSSGQTLAPSFSPALAVQKHGSGPVLVSLSAGEGDGPWWLSIRQGFGPLYVDQVGLGVTIEQDQLKKISLFFDGSISIVGLTAAVDDLQLTYSVTSGTSFFDPSNWNVDLAGLAVSADISGVTLAGGLRKYFDENNPDDIEYIGMLMARFGTYGLSIYGGYASITVEPEGKFTAFFAYGAIVGPIGGPPAFFLTGIGGGFGINRDIVVPDISEFDDFLFLNALDPAYTPADNLMEEMDKIRKILPAKQGKFWFAAGISFTSFAIVDGIAVVAVEFGDGFELNIFGLARMALPRPEARLVSIELALLARFSTEEGVIWIQAQLTDNSWLLHESARLTGGFAFVSWFAGPNKGQFVLTLGGYHPSFSREGYPVVPRLGFHWQPMSNIVIKGENYFALTSEAIMAGGGLEASATFGPAWAHVSFGANVIIYFDPFRYMADVHARISAGITIDFWIGKVTISISIGARIAVEGPDFRGTVTFEIGPVELTVGFGSSTQSAPNYIDWNEFVPKYLEESALGRATALSSLTGKGSVPPGVGAGGGAEKGTADGSAAHPFEVMSEFEMSITTTIPTNRLKVGTAPDQTFNTSLSLGLPPLNADLSISRMVLSLKKKGTTADLINSLHGDGVEKVTVTARNTGFFPAAVWGPKQDANDKKIPEGEVISAVEGADLKFNPTLVNRIEKEISFDQVEAGPRLPLPFLQSKTTRPDLLVHASALSDLIPVNPSAKQAMEMSKHWMKASGMGAAAVAGFEGRRAAPPRLLSLGERLVKPEPVAAKAPLKKGRAVEFDLGIKAPKVAALFAAPLRVDVAEMRTSVKKASDPKIKRMAPPSLASVSARFDTALASRLEKVAVVATDKNTLLSNAMLPKTKGVRSIAAFIGGMGADRETLAMLDEMTKMVAGEGARAARVKNASGILPGETVVLEMPNYRRAQSNMNSGGLTLSGGTANVTAFGGGGTPLQHTPDARGRIELPPQVERIVVTAAGTKGTKSGLDGWVAESDLAYIGSSTALCAGGTVFAEGATLTSGPEARKAGWISAQDLTAKGAISTRFYDYKPLLAVVIEGKFDPDASPDFTLTLDGAQESDINSPIVVDIGGRSVVILSLVQTQQKRKRPYALGVRFISAANSRISGVLVADGTAETLARDLADKSVEALLATSAQQGGKPVFATWAPNKKTKG